VLIRNKSFETTEIESQFTPVPANLDYKQAIAMLRGTQKGAGSSGR
jgi:hypothetical protein